MIWPAMCLRRLHRGHTDQNFLGPAGLEPASSGYEPPALTIELRARTAAIDALLDDMGNAELLPPFYFVWRMFQVKHPVKPRKMPWTYSPSNVPN